MRSVDEQIDRDVEDRRKTDRNRNPRKQPVKRLAQRTGNRFKFGIDLLQRRQRCQMADRIEVGYR
jgi:hypothetical protein